MYDFGGNVADSFAPFINPETTDEFLSVVHVMFSASLLIFPLTVPGIVQSQYRITKLIDGHGVDVR